MTIAAPAAETPTPKEGDRPLAGMTAVTGWLSLSRHWFTVLGLLAAVQTWLVLSHKPWIDEYQALQIALQSPDFSALLENLRYEGHPPLWYLILRAASLVVPTAWILPAVQLPIALGIQALIATRAEFTRVERLLIALSPFVLFDYGVLSRSLSLGVLLTLVAFAFRKHRLAWIAVVLLPMTDFLFGILSIIWLIIARAERRLWILGLAAWALSGLAAAWTVRPAPDMFPALWNDSPAIGAFRYGAHLSPLLIPLPISEGVLQWNSYLPVPFAVPVGMAFLVFAYYCSRPVRLHSATMVGFTTLTAFFSIAVYPLPIRHLSLIGLLLILLVWRGREIGRKEPPIFRFWLWFMAAGGLLTVAISAIKPFDTADQAVAYIRANHLEKKHWVADGNGV